MSEEVRMLDVRQITPSPYQPRLHFNEERLEELAQSIREHGVIQPVIVRVVGGEGYQLIAGERRLRAAQRAGLARIPAIVRPYTEEQAVETALIENLQREDISVVEAARAFQRLAADFHYSQSEIAQRTGKSRAAVNNTLRLLQLPEPVLDLLDRGDLSEGQARAILGLPYPELRTEVAEWAVRNAVPVRDLERKVRSLGERRDSSGPSGSAPTPMNANVAALEEQLRTHFGTKVALAYRKGRGTLSIEFYSDDDLTRILELLGLNGT